MEKLEGTFAGETLELVDTDLERRFKGDLYKISIHAVIRSVDYGALSQAVRRLPRHDSRSRTHT